MLGIWNIILLSVITSYAKNQVSATFKFNSNKNDFGLEIYSSAVHTNIQDDAILKTPQLIKKYGYEAEVHHVTTDDGYILELHRISGGPRSPPRKGKKVSLLVHGLLDSSAAYVLTGPGHGLGYMLADNDFDVWLVNCRGNTYSTNHTSYKPFGSSSERKQFWDFSWHEMGIHDLPAIIDYVLNYTGESKLQYIGHSQGATIFFVLLSEKPEYNNKIEMMHAMAPAVFMGHATSPPIRVITPFISILKRLTAFIGFDYFKPSEEFLRMAGQSLCRDEAITQILCENIIFLMMGWKSDQMNSTLLPVILAHTPAGCSTKQLIHFAQEVNSGRFRQYNYGFIGNSFEYEELLPPKYNLKNVQIPVVVYHSENDWFAGEKDVHKLIQNLPYCKSYLVPHKQFNHVDFTWGIDAPILVYEEILKNMKSSYIYTQKMSEL